jgi:hypothetical protein
MCLEVYLVVAIESVCSSSVAQRLPISPPSALQILEFSCLDFIWFTVFITSPNMIERASKALFKAKA